ncbi:MAG: ATP-binding response regulator [Planctomycetota bacterium]|jgi:CheY-like chemotaxis protein
MPTVLVVDDSKTDRLIVTMLLSKAADIDIRCVEDGESALATIESDPPDMVLTDLVMPGMDGLELVGAVRERFPSVPVVLMTSQGNEELAVRALKEGAASYVPKMSLAESLEETVREVTDLAGRQRAEERLLATLRRSESSFSLESHVELVRPLVKHLQEIACLMGLCDETERMQIGVAICEAVNNAIEHGNLEVPSELREKDIAAHTSLMGERRNIAPYCDRRVHVEARFDREKASFVIRDEGQGFDPTILPDPLDPANVGRLSGRGVMLIRSFMDEVTFNERGNQITMVKRRAKE